MDTDMPVCHTCLSVTSCTDMSVRLSHLSPTGVTSKLYEAQAEMKVSVKVEVESNKEAQVEEGMEWKVNVQVKVKVQLEVSGNKSECEGRS